MKSTLKTVISVTLCYLLVLFTMPLYTISAGATETTLQGAGTETSPYLINTAEDFMYAMETYAADENVYFSLENDINIVGQSTDDLYVSEFRAHLNGNLHTITADAMFAANNYGSITLLDYRNQKEYTLNCKYSGFVEYNRGVLSGIVVHADIKVYYGAILCYYNYGSITNCAAIGSIVSNCGYGNAAAGISLNNSSDSVVSNCYAAATVRATGGDKYGSPSKYPIAANSKYVNSVFDSTLYGSNPGDGYTTDVMKSAEIIPILNKSTLAEDSLWTLDTGNKNDGYPVLKKAFNAQITSSKTNVLISGTEYVTLSCSDADGQIYYTLDGSVPTDSSALYTGPIAISNTTTIRAAGYKNGLTGESVRFDYAKVSGNGTAGSPYIINCEAAFWAIAELPLSACFSLTADIELNKEFSSFGSFSGTFEGNNHTISSIGAREYQKGLFEENHGFIRNLHLESSGNAFMTNGALTYINYGVISNCSFEGTVNASVKDTGSYHYFEIPNTSNSYGGSKTLYGPGGFVSFNYGYISDSSFIGDMLVPEGDGNSVGGFVGVNDSVVKNCLFEGKMDVDDLRFGPTVVNYVGGFAGYNSINSLTENCTADTQRIDVYTSSYQGGTVYSFGYPGGSVIDCKDVYGTIYFGYSYLEWGSPTVRKQDLGGAGYTPASTASSVTGGSCGPEGSGAKWLFEPSTGTITIYGSGAMNDYYVNSGYSGSTAPWETYHYQINTIEIAPTVTSVGKNAFYASKADKLRVISDSGSDLLIGQYAFAYSELSQIDFGRINSGRNIILDERCFDSCNKLTSLTLPTGIRYSDYYYNDAFHHCDYLTDVDIYCPVVGRFMFETCGALTNVTLNGVTEIKTYAFRGNSINEITIPASVTTIGEYAFDTSIYSHTCGINLIKAPNCSEGHAYAVQYNVPFSATDSTAHTYQVNKWNWSADHTSATATIKCSAHNDFTQTVNAEVTVETKEATCTEDGYTKYTASVAFEGQTFTDVYTDTFTALGHDIIHHDAKEPECTEVGWEAYDTCSRCDYSTYVEIPALGHDWVEDLNIPATCTEEGFIINVCSRCHEEIESCPSALGHDLGEWVVTLEPTCTENGTKVRSCSRCEYTETETIEALGHDYQDVVTPATCTEGGYTTHTCSRCHDSYVTDETDALGHDLGEWTTTKEATCTENGEEKRTCSRCDYFETRVVDALGHDFGEWTTTVEASCTAAGEEKRTCSRCDHFETRVIDALGHDYQVVVTPATCTEGGYTTHTCSRCQDSYITDETAALGHNYSVTVRSAPTATRQGAIKYTCDRCGGTGNKTIPMLNADDYVMTNNTATCTDAGTATYTLKDTTYGVCVIENAVSPALGHDYILTPFDGDYHRNVCSRCAAADGEAEAHTFTNGVCSCGYKLPVITAQPADWTGAVGGVTDITVTAEGSGLTYRWYYRAAGAAKWSAASDTDNVYNITMTAARSGRELYCKVTDAYGKSVDSDVVTMSIAESTGPVITTQPADWTGAVGDVTDIEVIAEGSGLTYQWYYRAAGATKWSTASDTDNVYNITMTAVRSGRELYCKVTDAYGKSVDSDVVTMSIAESTGPVITTQPADWTGAAGETTDITVVAEGSGLTYLWYYRAAGKTKWTATSDTDNVYNITMTAARSGRELYCKVTDGSGKSVDSDVVTMTLAEKTGPVITTQPTDWTGANGANATFTVVAEGEGLTYLWYYRAAGKTKWIATSATEDTYSIVMTSARSGREYYCLITDANGDTVSSDIVTMKIG